MDKYFYTQLTQKSMAKELLSIEYATQILTASDIELIPLLNAAYEVRKKSFGKEITIHVINNVQNGQCSEDCKYCAQSIDSNAQINEYGMKSDEEILNEAKQAYESGAHRYCMVFSGRALSLERSQHLAALIQKIKATYPIQVCISHGFLDKEKAQLLKEAGLDRLNHNLNTSNRYYSDICTTHDYQDRIKTLQEAHNVNLQVCSGVLIGMGETAEDIYEMACSLKALKA
ncbi:MAG: biotin synthase BioB, partial [Candidatus Omnitrophica bacterium]|nr:biotin synthase BioB [Candidatus Omnitrophota bacterium]